LTQDGWKKVIDVFHETKSAFLIKTKSGKQIIASENHRFPTTSGIKNVFELTPGMKFFEVRSGYIEEKIQNEKTDTRTIDRSISE